MSDENAVEVDHVKMRGFIWPPSGDARFYAVLEEMALVHAKKSADYGGEGDPLANVMTAGDFGIPNWVGVALRMNDKMIRVKNMARKGKLENESIEDAFLDLASYAVLALIAYRASVQHDH